MANVDFKRHLFKYTWMQVNPNLADWFAGDPVERIVNLENSLIARKREVEKFFLGFVQFF